MVVSETFRTLVLAFKLWQRFGLNMPMTAGEVDIATTMSLNMFNRVSRLASLDHSIHGKLKDLERYFLITEQLPRGAPAVIETCRPPKQWPSNGQIEFHNYSMQYNPTSSMVLCNLSFAVGCQEKIGIVGRTGAGKSSLVQAIMRMVEPAAGKIIIDGVDIATIGLHDLRSRISIIPQDPTLFEGSIRDNLDPMDEYTDDEVWAAIRATHIEGLLEKPTRKYVEDPDDEDNDIGVWVEGVGINKWVEYGGSNFSVGERQLISLCRALLWKRKILVLDEATANIDNKTDQLIQTVLRDEFRDCTVLTIAHRLNTVMDSDRILVMDQGTVAEFDSPKNLLARDGPFTQLVASMKLNHGEIDSNE
ncbi:Canalicular multispecific organic anion transporter 1 [Coemansia sp. RSA 678]|nr:Canalicular multispecific organic anion transporter 1 [Coemansia sp. RSA 678]